MTDIILWLCVTVAVGVAGSVLLYRLGLPAGAMVGAIVFVGAFQILTGQGWFPKVVKTAVQALVGGFIGQPMDSGAYRRHSCTLTWGRIKIAIR